MADIRRGCVQIISTRSALDLTFLIPAAASNHSSKMNWGIYENEKFNRYSALPYFDNSVAVPDMLKKPYFDFESHTPLTHPPTPKKKIEPNRIIITLFYFA